MAKTIGWLISMSFVISGLFFAQVMTDTGSIEPMILVIFSFGIVFWLSKTTYETSKKVMGSSLGMLILSAAVAKYIVADLLAEWFGIGFYFSWEICMLALGGPVMAYVFKHPD
jgi:hypothetical protein